MTLHDQLERLAERAEPQAGPTGGELWDRGTRYRRRMRTGTASIAAVTLLGLAVLTGVALDRSGPAPEPSPANAPVGLPSRIWTPSPWLPGTDEVGPPGQVAAVFETDRGSWTGSQRSVVAISAATGDYRFLDLEDRADGNGDAALSPDGRKVAYWTTGPTTDTPNTTFTEERTPPPAGVAVLDLVTGDVHRHPFVTEHGLWTEELAWLDDEVLVTRQLQFVAGDDGSDMDQGSGTDETIWRWDLSEEEPVRWTEAERLEADDWSPPADGTSLVGADERLHVVEDEAVGPPVARSGWFQNDEPVVSPDGTLLAGIWGNSNRSPEDVVVVPVGSRRTIPTTDWRLTRAGASFRVDGWIDDDHVAVTRRSQPLRQGDGMEVSSVDVTTGEPTTLVRLPDQMYNGVQWATDLLDSPVVDRPAPPEPLDPRVVTTGWALLAGIGLLSLWGWRRRVRP